MGNVFTLIRSGLTVVVFAFFMLLRKGGSAQGIVHFILAATFIGIRLTAGPNDVATAEATAKTQQQQQVSAQDTVSPPGIIKLQKASPQVALIIYQELSGLELDIPQIPYTAISITTDKPITRSEAIKLLEKELREQAGIIIKKVDDKHATVAYDASAKRASAQDPVFPPGFLKLQNTHPKVALEVYQQLSGLKLVIPPIPHTVISISTDKPMTRTEAIKLLEKELREQAGIIIKKVDDKQATVTYKASAKRK